MPQEMSVSQATANIQTSLTTLAAPGSRLVLQPGPEALPLSIDAPTYLPHTLVLSYKLVSADACGLSPLPRLEKET